MALTLILFVFLAAVFTFKSWMVRYSWLFLLICFSLSGTLYAILLSISINSTYRVFGFIGEWDKYIFYSIAGFRMGFFKTIRLFNISVALYIVALPLFVRSYFTSRHSPLRLGQLPRLLPLLLFPAFYVWFYDQQTSYYFYQKILEGHISFSLISMADLLNYAVLILYMVVPLLYIFAKYKTLATYYKKRQIVGVALNIISFDIMFGLIYSTGIVRNVYFTEDVGVLVAVKSGFRISPVEYMAFMAVIGVLMAAILFSMFRYHVAPRMGLIGRFMLVKNMQKLNKSFVNIFHSVKKTMFLYKITLEKAMLEEPERQKETLAALAGQIDSYINYINKMLSVNNDIEIFAEKVDVVECAENAARSYSGEESITLEVLPAKEEILVEADPFYLEDVFENIIKNSVEAIKRKKNEGKVTIQIGAEHEWAVISIADDGEGISKQNLKNVFRPLFTTKAITNNCGIGLTFAYKIIKLHMGHIHIESTRGEGTTVNILLPRR